MNSNDLTKGNITKQLISYALPLLIGALIQQLYSTVDMMFVGRVLGTNAAAAVGSSNMIVNCIIGFFTGLSVGVGVIVGQSCGSGDLNRLSRVIHCSAALTLIMGVSVLILSVILAPFILRMMDVPENIFPLSVLYIRIYLCSVLSIVSYNVGTGILKALGDSKTPTFYQLIGGIANVIGNYLFIVVLDLGVAGAAMTTLMSQTLAAGLTVSRLFRLPDAYRLRIGRIKLEKGLATEILGVGIPSAIQSIMISISNVFVQTNINRLEVVSIAAFTAYYKVENLIYYPIMAVSQACSAFISQNIGAGAIDRAREITKKAILLGVMITVCTSGGMLLLSIPAFSLFSNDPAVITLGSRIGHVTFPFYFMYVFLEVYAASIRGAGKAMPTMIITLVNMCLVRVCILTIVMSLFHNVLAVAAVYPMTWFTNSLSLYLYYRSGRWVPGEAV